MGFEFYREHTVDACPEYEAALEEYRDENGNQMMTAHISVEPELFTPEVYKTIIRRFKLLREVLDVPLYAVEPNPDDEKWERFIAPLGFSQLMRVGCTDGQSRRLFVSKKNKEE